MGYLSCRARSAVSISDPRVPTSAPSSSSLPPPRTHGITRRPADIQHFDYSDLETATNGFSDQKILGKGSHGCVYKAVLRSGRHVAVKKPSLRHGVSKNGVPREIAVEVENEIDILSKLHSPGLVNLLGFTDDPKRRLLVVEFMSNGSLYDVLHLNPNLPNWGRRIQLALQTAKAIETLHSSLPPVIHRDIKSSNVLIDRNFDAKLGDFGLALRSDGGLHSTPPAGTMGYLDPCYVTPGNVSTKTDVFSFGILLLEIISGRKAIDVVYSPPSIVDWAIPLIKKGKLLSIYDPRLAPLKDPFVRKQLAVMAAKCVRSCKEKRPMMEEIVDCLSRLSNIVPLHSWNGFSNPCMMLDNIGHGVNSNSDVLTIRPAARGVYSDLGFRRSNLMELLTEFHGDSDGPSRSGRYSSFRGTDKKLVRKLSSD